MNNKIILHFTCMKSTKYGALEHYFVEMIRLCALKGYKTVLQYESPPHSSVYMDDLTKLGGNIAVQATHTKSSHSLSRIIRLIFSIRPEIIEVHFANPFTLLVTPIISRIFGVQKIIAVVHSNLRLKKNALRRFAFNQYDHVLAVSNAVAENLLYAGVKPKIVSTHYLGLFGQREQSPQFRYQLRNEFAISEQAVVMACIAFDTPFKGLDILLDAFEKVVRNHPHAHLIIVGVDPQRSVLTQQAAKLGLSNRVHWAGIRDEGWQILNAADIYVQSSRFAEGLPLAIMEAMSLRLPVVATRVSGIPEAVIDGETGYLADPANVESLATAMNHILSEPSKWKMMGEAGYNRYLHLFRGENSVQTMVENYFRL